MHTRRDFLATSGSAAGGAWLMRVAPFLAATQACARDALRDGRPFTVFTEREGADFDALAARIIPTDDTPGAREAGAVHFADLALDGWGADLLPLVRPGLERLAERGLSAHSEPFSELSDDEQDELIRQTEREDPGFFFFGRMLVTLSLSTNPEHGGNTDQVGWRLMGFEPGFVHQPPFGYYDRDEHGTGAGE